MLHSLCLGLTLAADPSVFDSRFTKAEPTLEAKVWKKAPLVVAAQDRFGKPLPEHRTEIRSLWTPTHLYFLFTANYQSMYLRPTPQLDKETHGLWDYDVVEVFIGHDLEKINLYKEFEVSPRGEWVDLDIDRKNPKSTAGWKWNSDMKQASANS